MESVRYEVYVARKHHHLPKDLTDAAFRTIYKDLDDKIWEIVYREVRLNIINEVNT